MGDDSVILLDEMLLPDSHVHWHVTQIDLTMMTGLASIERTKLQWAALLDSVGLKIIKTYTYTPSVYETLMVVVRKWIGIGEGFKFGIKCLRRFPVDETEAGLGGYSPWCHFCMSLLSQACQSTRKEQLGLNPFNWIALVDASTQKILCGIRTYLCTVKLEALKSWSKESRRSPLTLRGGGIKVIVRKCELREMDSKPGSWLRFYKSVDDTGSSHRPGNKSDYSIWSSQQEQEHACYLGAAGAAWFFLPTPALFIPRLKI